MAFFVSSEIKWRVLKAIVEVEESIEGEITMREYWNGVIGAFEGHFEIIDEVEE